MAAHASARRVTRCARPLRVRARRVPLDKGADGCYTVGKAREGELSSELKGGTVTLWLIDWLSEGDGSYTQYILRNVY